MDRTRTQQLLDDEMALMAYDLAVLAAGLGVLTDVEYALGGFDAASGVVSDGPPTREQVSTYLFALTREVGEVADELGWKPWKNPPGVDKDRLADEAADVLAFLGIMVTYLHKHGVSNLDLACAFAKKTTVNYDRLRGKVPGYGGRVATPGGPDWTQLGLFDQTREPDPPAYPYNNETAARWHLAGSDFN